ncbi:MAG: NAD(+) diphosphatase [Eubacteriales bacterium]|nr:NAD(+) diphosphatase [Eubacteriales bacterium]
MLINLQPEKFSLLYDHNPCDEDDTVLLFYQGNILLKDSGDGGRFPLWRQVAGLCEDAVPAHLFTQDNRRYFYVRAEHVEAAPEGYSFQSVRAFRTLQPEVDGFLLNAANHLTAWYGTHRYCGVCAGKMLPAPVERALICESCGHVVYPVISPAVIVALTDDDRILLARNANGVFRHFSLLAGYVEVGETAEQAVKREIMEEVGLNVRNIRYLASQPWGLSQSMMIGFHAELDGDAKITLQVSELAEARWYSRSELAPMDNTASIAFEIIERFRTGKL